MDIFNKELCGEIHESIDKILDSHERRLDGHDVEIGSLKVNETKHETEINQLCKSIGDLVSTTKWFIGLTLTGFIGFFFYAVQKVVFK